MTETEIIARGIVAGMAIVLPFLGITIAKWHSWKGWAKFWQMMHKDLQMQNERLFKALTTQTNLVLKLKRDRNWESSQHHKYKRCLGLAKVCECRTAYTCGRRLRHNLMWRERWLKLAEYFKECDNGLR